VDVGEVSSQVHGNDNRTSADYVDCHALP
jgi:hypothetical protein